MFGNLIDRVVTRKTAEIRIAMLGPRRAGKTSMLTAMYERFENALIAEKVANQVFLEADENTKKVLSANFAELRRIIEEGGNVSEAITGDSEARTYSFDLKRSRASRDTQIRLIFQDYPGGWLVSGANDASNYEYKKVLSFVRDANVLLVAVDAPYLMEHAGVWHERRNLPKLIAKTVSEAWGSVDATPRMIILVPIKCEKYDKNDEQRKQLIEATRTGYSDLISNLSGLPHCAVICVPAQTTGCVTFDSFRETEDGSIPAPVFTMPEERGYNPRDCSQTLRYCLVYALNRYVKDAGVGWAGRVREFFKLDQNFVVAARILASGCRGVFFQTMKK